MPGLPMYLVQELNIDTALLVSRNLADLTTTRQEQPHLRSYQIANVTSKQYKDH